MKKTAAVLTLLAAFALPVMAAEDGAALYKAKCSACHGADGAKLAKAVIKGKSAADVKKALETDAKHKTKLANAEQIEAVAGYVAGLK